MQEEEEMGPHSIMDGSLVSRMWSVSTHGMDISMGNCHRQNQSLGKADFTFILLY